MKISKSFKKSEVVIYAIALMLVTAGYFNYTTNVENVSSEVYSENIAEIDKNEKNNEKKEDEEDIGDAKLVNSEVEENTNNENNNKKDISTSAENSKEKTEDLNTQNSQEKPTDVEPKDSEVKQTNVESQDSEQKSDDNDYFVLAKLERETNFATTISNYTKILEDSHISNTEKAIAMKEITKINNTKNAISVCENILLTKGFEKVIVLVNDKSVNVVVKSQGLNTKSVAQIQNIVSRELGTDIANIHITENSK